MPISHTYAVYKRYLKSEILTDLDRIYEWEGQSMEGWIFFNSFFPGDVAILWYSSPRPSYW